MWMELLGSRPLLRGLELRIATAPGPSLLSNFAYMESGYWGLADRFAGGTYFRSPLGGWTKTLNGFVDRAYVAEECDPVLQGEFMFGQGEGRESVFYHHCPEILHHGITGGRIAADVGCGPAYQDGVNAMLLQRLFQC